MGSNGRSSKARSDAGMASKVRQSGSGTTGDKHAARARSGRGQLDHGAARGAVRRTIHSDDDRSHPSRDCTALDRESADRGDLVCVGGFACADEPGGTTVEAIHAVDRVAMVAHPFARLMRSVSQFTLERLLAGHERERCPDAIQVARGSGRASAGNSKALELNATGWHLSAVRVSGAVFEEQLASAYTLFPVTLRPGARAAELRRVAEQRGRELRYGWGRAVCPVLDRLSLGDAGASGNSGTAGGSGESR